MYKIRVFVALCSLVALLSPQYSAFAYFGETFNSYPDGSKIFTATAAYADSGTYGMFGSFQESLISNCQSSDFEWSKDLAECDYITDSFKQAVEVIKKNNRLLLRSEMKKGTFWFLDSFFTEWHWFQEFKIIETRNYQNGVLFLAVYTNPGWQASDSWIDDYWIGFIQHLPRYGEIKAQAFPIAPEGSLQYANYTSLYGSDDQWSFHKDIRRSFLRNRFGNKEVQKMYTRLLEYVDNNTPSK